MQGFHSIQQYNYSKILYWNISVTWHNRTWHFLNWRCHCEQVSSMHKVCLQHLHPCYFNMIIMFTFKLMFNACQSSYFSVVSKPGVTMVSGTTILAAVEHWNPLAWAPHSAMEFLIIEYWVRGVDTLLNIA